MNVHLSLRKFALLSALASVLLTSCATNTGTTATTAPAATTPEAVQASPRNTEYPWMSMERWYHMHAEDVGIAAQGEARLLFVGNSITEGWPASLMDSYFGKYQPANFGIGGDRTENLLWRLQNGSVGALEPEVVSLLIGVNNFGLRGDEPAEVIAGIEAVVQQLQQSFPAAHIVLHGIFPYKQYGDSPERAQVKQVNAAISRLAEDPAITWLDIGEKLTEANGDLAAEIMPDFLHLSDKGYRIWAKALAPVVDGLMQPRGPVTAQALGAH